MPTQTLTTPTRATTAAFAIPARLLELPAPTDLPAIHVTLPDGGHGEIPAAAWPAGAGRQLSFGDVPLIAVHQIDKKLASRLLIGWEHPLHVPDGPGERAPEYTRPFGYQAWLMEIAGKPAAVAISASSVNGWVAKDVGLARRDVVDLARIARSPAEPAVMRAMLRLWREYLGPRWADRYWVPKAAVAHSLPGTASSSVDATAGTYRFDGWERLKHGSKPFNGGKATGRQSASRADKMGDGAKSLWAWSYDGPLRTQLPAC